MSKTPIIIDTDPGIDDALAIAMLAASDKVEIQALTATHGNVGLEGTSRNALQLSEFLGINCIVAKGADRPMIVEQKNAAEVHGVNGLAGYELPKATGTFSDELAWDVMYKLSKKADGKMQLVVLGPMTNVAIAILKYPDFKDYIDRIYMMGGSRDFGNHSQNAEFNIWGDPHACEIVLHSGIPITMCDLVFGADHPLTGLQVKTAYDNAKKLKPMLQAFWEHDMQWQKRAEERTGVKIDWREFPFHIYDATAAGALLLQDSLICEDYYVMCETQGTETEGQTVIDYKNHFKQNPNVQLAIKMDLDKYYEIFKNALAHFE